jgi:benzoate membrane transport protein
MSHLRTPPHYQIFFNPTDPGSLSTAMTKVDQREPALITFLVTASGVSLFGAGSAFWGLIAGALALFAFRRKQ